VEKNNLSAKPPILACRHDGALSLTWETGPVDGDTDAALRGPQAERNGGPSAAAEAFIRDALADGPVLSEDLKRGAVAAGISERTYERANTIIVAARQYEAQHGRLPDQLDELVPAFIASIPSTNYTLIPPINKLCT
jgi:hypothetical protein